MAALVAAWSAAASGIPCRLPAQTLDDALLLGRRELRFGTAYHVDDWREYWESTCRRRYSNLGTVTTQRVDITAAYGLHRRVSLLLAVPYVRTAASRGPMAGHAGWQDLSVADKGQLFEVTPTTRTTLRATALVGVGRPVTHHVPDVMPLAIGLGARHARVHAAMPLLDRSRLFAGVAAGYQWRSTVTLARPAYFAEDRLVLSDEVRMPDVRDVQLTLGYQDAQWRIPISLVQQRTLGGGDMRPEEMPFVGNRVDRTRLQLQVQHTMAHWPFVLGGAAETTVAGRNVSRSTVFSGSVSYVLGR